MGVNFTKMLNQNPSHKHFI